MSARELTEWMIYEEDEPFGFPIDYHHSSMLAIIAAMIHNAARGKGQPSVRPQKFLPFKVRKRMPTSEDQQEWARMLKAMCDSQETRK
jgi:hypothetical protein